MSRSKGASKATDTGALTGAAAFGGVATGVAVGYAIISGLQQAELIRTQAEISKKINDMNAQYADLDAFNAEADGFGQVARYGNEIDKTLAGEKSAYAAENVDINFGTAKEVQAETKLTGFLNTLDIKNQAHAKAMGYVREARNTRLQGVLNQGEANLQASATESAAVLNAGKSVAGYYTK